MSSRDDAVQLPCRVRFLASDPRVCPLTVTEPGKLHYAANGLDLLSLRQCDMEALRSVLPDQIIRSVVSSLLVSVIAPLVEISAWQHNLSLSTFVLSLSQSSLCTEVRLRKICSVAFAINNDPISSVGCKSLVRSLQSEQCTNYAKVNGSNVRSSRTVRFS